MVTDYSAVSQFVEEFSIGFVYKPAENKIYLSGNPAKVLPIGNKTVFELDSFLGFLIDEDQKQFERLLAEKIVGISFFATLKNKDGEDSFCSVYFRILENQNDVISGMLVNISGFMPDNYLFKDLKALVGGLAEIRKITHDLNNQFQIIMGFASAIADEAKDPETKESATCIVNGVEKAIDHNKTLRKFFPPKNKPEVFIPDLLNDKRKTKEQDADQKEENEQKVQHQQDQQKTQSSEKPAEECFKNVLVIDDEPLVNKFLCQMLKRLKFKSEGFKCGNDALKHIKSCSNKFDLAIIDMNLPDISTEFLFNEISSIDPDMKVILISGDSLNESSQKMLNQGAKGYLQKPTTVKKLSQTINEALA